jgi:radical SAM superfamily enzyme YgiQ (UPF0313 family)
MKILLTTLNAKYIHINLAIRLLYQLNKSNEGLNWKEFTIKENKNDIAEHCKDYDVVCFSCYIWNITPTLEVAKKIKALNPNTKIMLGGPEVSYEWQDVIANESIDFIIVGEGEIPFADFLKSYPDVKNVPNLVSKINGDVHYNPQNVMFELENYSSINPYIGDKPEDLKNRVLYIETSRGCPYKCEFCLASLDNKVRYLPIENIKSNLFYLMQHGKVIKFLDRTFNVKRDFTIDMFQFILDHHKPENVFQFEITADILHPDIMQFIHDKIPKGLFRFEIGIQTVNQKANLEVSRKQNFDKTSGVILNLKNKIEMHLDLIVGLPLDYWEDIKYSFEEVFKLYPPELQLGFLKFLKGTPVRHKYAQHDYVFDPMPPYQIIKSKYLSEHELQQITVAENALEIYWNKKRTLNTLKYITKNYSIFDFLLGLGNYFATQKSFHQHYLKDIYDIAFQFAEINFKDDNIIKELIAIDYYLQNKVRPQVLYIEDLPKKEKNKILIDLKLNLQKFRFIAIPISFDFTKWQSENIIQKGSFLLIIQYSGTEKPEIANCISEFEKVADNLAD